MHFLVHLLIVHFLQYSLCMSQSLFMSVDGQVKAFVGYISGCFALNLSLVCIATFTVSLELQEGHCSDQLTLICRHSETGMAPLWIHNGTVESGEVLGTAFPGAMYTVLTKTEHTTTITGVCV